MQFPLASKPLEQGFDLLVIQYLKLIRTVNALTSHDVSLSLGRESKSAQGSMHLRGMVELVKKNLWLSDLGLIN